MIRLQSGEPVQIVRVMHKPPRDYDVPVVWVTPGDGHEWIVSASALKADGGKQEIDAAVQAAQLKEGT